MNQSVRQQEILRLLHSRRLCTVIELSESFNVSEETIRRDIRQIEETGAVVKIHGGVRLQDNCYETPMMTRMKERSAPKQRIAEKAADLISDGESLFIDSGTTSVTTAQALASKRSLTILTDSIEVAREIYGYSNTRVFLAGGEVNLDYGATYGPTANDYIAQFSTDTAILSIGSIDAEVGLLDYHMGEVEVKRIAIQHAKRVIIVADSFKFQRGGLIKTADFEDIDILVTDKEPPAELKEVMSDVEVIVVDQD